MGSGMDEARTLRLMTPAEIKVQEILQRRFPQSFWSEDEKYPYDQIACEIVRELVRHAAFAVLTRP